MTLPNRYHPLYLLLTMLLLVTLTASTALAANALPPTAVDDDYTVPFGANSLTINGEGVSANDSKKAGAGVYTQLVSNVSFGTLQFGSNGSFVYAFSGAAPSSPVTFTYKLIDQTDGNSESNVATVTINFASNGADAVADAYSVNEDGTLTANGGSNPAGVLGNDTGTGLTATLITDVTDGTLSLASDGTFTYTPDADFFGTDSFVYEAEDGSGNTDQATATITVNAVNDEPSFTPGGDVTRNEDDGAVTVAAWATALSAGPANESGQTLSFTVSNDNNALFSVQPAINASGDLTFTTATNANGTAEVTVSLVDNGGTANGGDDTFGPLTFDITLTSVNDAPVATDNDYTTDEDSDVSGNVITDDTGDGVDSDVSSNVMTVVEVNGAPFTPGVPFALPSGALLTMASDGSFTYDPNGQYEGLNVLNPNGVDGFTYLINDGIDDAASAATVTVVIEGINDAPVFDDTAGQLPDREDFEGDDFTGGNAIGFTFADVDGGVDWPTVTATGLPSGITVSMVDPNSAELEGTLAVGSAGVYTVEISLDDGQAAPVVHTFTWTVRDFIVRILDGGTEAEESTHDCISDCVDNALAAANLDNGDIIEVNTGISLSEGEFALATPNITLRSVDGTATLTLAGRGIKINRNGITVGGTGMGFTLVNDTGINAISVGDNQAVTGTVVQGNTFEMSVSNASTAAALIVQDQTSTTDVDLLDNTFGPLANADGGMYGVWLEASTDVDDVLLDGNTFDGITSTNGAAVGLYADAGISIGVDVDDNTFANITGGTSSIGMYFGLNVADVDNGENTVGTNTTDGVGIFVEGAGDVSIYRDVISGNATGIYVPFLGVTMSVEQNEITANDVGLDVDLGAAFMTIRGNSISGNTTTGVRNNDASALDASGNWWGSADVADVIDATDDGIGGAVDYSPWLISGVDTDAGPVAAPDAMSGVAATVAGFQGDFATLRVDAASLQANGTGGNLQEGLDLVDNSVAGKVIAEAGSYPEDLSMMRDNVELMGQGCATTIIVGQATDLQTTFPLVTTPNVDIQADGVSLHGFTLDFSAPADERYNGVVFTGANTKIYDNCFVIGMPTDFDTIVDRDGNTTVAIQSWHGDVAGTTIDGSMIYGNTFDGTTATEGYYGVYLNADNVVSDNVTITGNTMTGTFWRGITTERSSVEIANNTLEADNDFSLWTGTSGIRLVRWVTPAALAADDTIRDVEVQGNTAQGASSGAGFAYNLLIGDGIGDFEDITNENNTFDGGIYGVFLGPAPTYTNVSISGDEIANMDAGGISVGGTVLGLSVEDNSIHDNGFGIVIDPSVDGDNVMVQYNMFADNTTGALVFGGSTGVIDARFNYWGDTAGPDSPADADTDPVTGAVANNAAGQSLSSADLASIRFDPWTTDVLTLSAGVHSIWSGVNPTIGLTLDDPDDDVAGKNVIAFQFELRFDPDVIQVDAATPITTSGSLSDGWSTSASVDNTNGVLEVFAASSTALTAEGKLIFVNFLVQGDGTTALDLRNVLLNQGDPQAAAIDGSMVVSATPLGDVTGTGGISAADAAAILSYLADPIGNPLTGPQLARADVSGDGSLTAYDAALVLQYSVGLITCFPAQAGCVSSMAVPDGLLTFADAVDSDDALTLPLFVQGAAGVTSVQFTATFDASQYEVSDLQTLLPDGWMVTQHVDNGTLTVAMAGTTPLQGEELGALRLRKRFANANGTVEAAGFVGEQAQAEFTGGTAAALPTAYGLDAAYPNPFVSEAHIGYSLPEAAEVKIVVYNTLGQVVRVLVDEAHEAGAYTATWDGATSTGARAANGVYVYRIEAGDFSAVQKLMLVK